MARKVANVSLSSFRDETWRPRPTGSALGISLGEIFKLPIRVWGAMGGLIFEMVRHVVLSFPLSVLCGTTWSHPIILLPEQTNTPVAFAPLDEHQMIQDPKKG